MPRLPSQQAAADVRQTSLHPLFLLTCFISPLSDKFSLPACGRSFLFFSITHTKSIVSCHTHTHMCACKDPSVKQDELLQRTIEKGEIEEICFNLYAFRNKISPRSSGRSPVAFYILTSQKCNSQSAPFCFSGPSGLTHKHTHTHKNTTHT